MLSPRTYSKSASDEKDFVILTDTNVYFRVPCPPSASRPMIKQDFEKEHQHEHEHEHEDDTDADADVGVLDKDSEDQVQQRSIRLCDILGVEYNEKYVVVSYLKKIKLGLPEASQRRALSSTLLRKSFVSRWLRRKWAVVFLLLFLLAFFWRSWGYNGIGIGGKFNEETIVVSTTTRSPPQVEKNNPSSSSLSCSNVQIWFMAYQLPSAADRKVFYDRLSDSCIEGGRFSEFIRLSSDADGCGTEGTKAEVLWIDDDMDVPCVSSRNSNVVSVTFSFEDSAWSSSSATPLANLRWCPEDVDVDKEDEDSIATARLVGLKQRIYQDVDLFDDSERIQWDIVTGFSEDEGGFTKLCSRIVEHACEACKV